MHRRPNKAASRGPPSCEQLRRRLWKWHDVMPIFRPGNFRMFDRSAPLLRILSRLPAGTWFRGLAALVFVIVLAAFGLALFASIAALVLLAVFGFKLRDYVQRWFTRTPTQTATADAPSGRASIRVYEADYVIVDRRERR